MPELSERAEGLIEDLIATNYLYGKRVDKGGWGPWFCKSIEAEQALADYIAELESHNA